MYLSAGVTKVVGHGRGCGVARASGVRAFSSTVTYGPFSRDYIQSSDLTRKRRLGSRQTVGWPRLWMPIGAARFVPSETEKRISPIFSSAKISSSV